MKKKHNIFLLGLTSLFNDLSSEMIAPILPLFINSLGGSGIAIGLIGGFKEGISSFVKLLSGYSSDLKGKRKKFIISGYLWSSIFKLGLAFSLFWQQVLFLIAFERIGKGLRTSPRDALISESANKSGISFGFHRSLDTLGAVLGTMIVIIIFLFFKLDYFLIFILAAIFSFISLIPLLFVKEVSKNKQKYNFKIFINKLTPELKKILTITGLFGLANFSYMFLILRMLETINSSNPTLSILILYLIFNITITLFSIPFGNLYDNLGTKTIAIGYFLFAIVNLGFILTNSFYIYFILLIIYGLFYSMIDGNQRAMISDLSSKHKGTSLGIFHMTIGFASIISSLIAGYLWQYHSHLSTFYYGGTISLLSAVLLFIIKK